MNTERVAIRIDEELLAKIDHLVEKKVFVNRSSAIQEAIEDKLAKANRNRLKRECAKLDAKFEQRLAEEGMGQELDEWPEY